MVGEIQKSLGKTKPLHSLTGPISTRGLQKAVNRLQADKVKKIVVIWLGLYSQSSDVDQLKYLLGINKLPSRAYMDSWKLGRRKIKRVKSKVPIVLAGGLDNHASVSEILHARAKEMSRTPKRESVILIGYGSTSDEENIIRQSVLESLARSVHAKGKFKEVRTSLIRPSTKEKPRLREDSLRTLRAVIKDSSVRSRVILVPHSLKNDGQERRLKKDLRNLFYRWRGKVLLPDTKIAAWVGATAESTAALEDMVEFKDDGQSLPPVKKKRNVK
jgi:hypothetical protein